jgi:hypothetical protein
VIQALQQRSPLIATLSLKLRNGRLSAAGRYRDSRKRTSTFVRPAIVGYASPSFLELLVAVMF